MASLFPQVDPSRDLLWTERGELLQYSAYQSRTEPMWGTRYTRGGKHDAAGKSPQILNALEKLT